MQTTLGQFNETTSTDAFALQNSKLLKVSLNQIQIQAKLGAMVAYRYAAMHPDEVQQLVLMDAPVPGTAALAQVLLLVELSVVQ